jgi:mannose-6-phosphate isomerase
LEQIKKGLPLSPPQSRYAVVGESWEISVDPAFPSVVVDLQGRPSLADLIQRNPEVSLGSKTSKKWGGCPLLVKILDTALPLSVQVHPSHDYPGLLPHQSGKPESWIILSAERGAGLYLGFSEGVTQSQVEDSLNDNADLSKLLNFVPVKTGDCFHLASGTVHAIGAGITLIEPQLIIPGKTGQTYRFWDWNRHYDALGQPTEQGKPRQLHTRESLSVTNFNGPQGEALVEGLRKQPTSISLHPTIERYRYIDGPHYWVDRINGTGALTLDETEICAVVVLQGRMTCRCLEKEFEFNKGESFVLPAGAFPATVSLDSCTAFLNSPYH